MPKNRLSKEQWLDRSLMLLEEHGPGALTLDSLTRHLGVTTGSFYWHFQNHREFLQALTDLYVERYTHVVAKHLEALDLPPRELLVEAMRQIVTAGLGGMDLHFRSLAISYPFLADQIRQMDEFRTGVISRLFRAMGYSGRELTMRVHTFVVLNSMEHAIWTGLNAQDRLKLFDERVGLLID